jgi:hypothetical protein
MPNADFKWLCRVTLVGYSGRKEVDRLLAMKRGVGVV